MTLSTTQGLGRAALAAAVSLATFSGSVGFTPTARAASVVAAAPEAGPAGARVKIDATALGDAADGVATQVRAGVEKTLKLNGIEAVDDPAAPLIVLTVSELGGDSPGYRCANEIRVQGETVAGSASVSDCRLCTEGELVETAMAAVETKLDQLRELGQRPAEPAAPDCDAIAASGTPEAEWPAECPVPECDTFAKSEQPPRCKDTIIVTPPPPPDKSKKGPMGTLGKAGIGVLAVGGVGLIGGIVLIALPAKPIDGALRRTTTLPGIGVAAGGGVAMIAGAVMLIIDNKNRKKSASAASARVTPSGWVGPGMTGVGLRGRF